MRPSFALGVFFVLLSATAFAEIRPEKVHAADSKKTQAYVRDGMVVGGDHAVDEVIIKEIRRASNPGFERLVIDLQGNHGGEPVAIPRPPYFQVAINPDEKRAIVTLWGRPRLEFDSKKVMAAFKKSSAIQNVMLLPRLEEESWSFVLELKAGYPIEVFELTDPVRIIMDVKTDASAAAKGKK